MTLVNVICLGGGAQTMIAPCYPMNQANFYPTGEYLDEHWLESDHGDLGLIAVPGSAEPVVVQWSRYECERGCHPPEYVGVFEHGARLLLVRERYQHDVSAEHALLRQRFRYASAEGVCCTELVLVLAAGHEIALERVEKGAYAGLWRGDIHVPARHLARLAHGLGAAARARIARNMTCRLVFDPGRGVILLFRRRSYARSVHAERA